MKKLSITTLFTFCLLLVSISVINAQVLRPTGAIQNTNLQYISGSIEGVVYIKKNALPPGTSINQVVVAVKQGLKACEFVPQSEGFFSAQYIHVSKSKVLGNVATVSLKSNTDSYAIEYSIPKLPLMKPLRVDIVGNAVKNLGIGVEPLLKNFPVAYLTTCDNTFECYNFSAAYIPPPK